MKPIVTLTGIVSEPEAGLSILIGYYFKSTDINMRNTNEDAISFVKDLHEDDPVNAITESLKKVLRQHFDEASVEVTLVDNEYTVNLEVIDDGRRIQLNNIHPSVPSVLNDGEY